MSLNTSTGYYMDHFIRLFVVRLSCCLKRPKTTEEKRPGIVKFKKLDSLISCNTFYGDGALLKLSANVLLHILCLEN